MPPQPQTPPPPLQEIPAEHPHSTTKILAAFVLLIAIVAGAGWWYLHTSNSSQPAVEFSTLENGNFEAPAVQSQNSNIETPTQLGSLPVSPPKEQATQENPKPPTSAESDPTCVITASKSVYQHEEPMTFSWKIQNAQMANLLIKTEAEDQDDSLTNVLSPDGSKNLTKVTRAVRSSGNVTATLQLYSYGDAGMKPGTCSITVVVK